MTSSPEYKQGVSENCRCGDMSVRHTRGCCHTCYAKQHREFFPERANRRSGAPQTRFRKPPLQPNVSESCRCHLGTRRRGVCDPCWQWHHRQTDHGRTLQIQAQKRYRQRHPDRAAASLRKWVDKNRPTRRAINNAYRVRNKDRVYLSQLKRKFGITSLEYQELYEMQKGSCAICHVSEDKLGQRLCLDHDHATNEPRGLVCRGCNLCLGFHERRGTGAFKHYLDFPPVARMRKMRTLTDEERALWNW